MITILRTILAVFVVIILLPLQNALAQCANCAATVESNVNSGGSVAKGLNNGIMFLLAMPYLAIVVVGIIWYKKYRRKNIPLDVPNEKLNLN